MAERSSSYNDDATKECPRKPLTLMTCLFSCYSLQYIMSVRQMVSLCNMSAIIVVYFSNQHLHISFSTLKVVISTLYGRLER
jgi:hypothetical protein